MGPAGAYRVCRQGLNTHILFSVWCSLLLSCVNNGPACCVLKRPGIASLCLREQHTVNLLHNIMGLFLFFLNTTTTASAGFLRECFQPLLVSIWLRLHVHVVPLASSSSSRAHFVFEENGALVTAAPSKGISAMFSKSWTLAKH